MQRVSTVAAILRWGSRNTSSSSKSTTTKRSRFGAWTSSSTRLRRPTRKRVRSCRVSSFRSTERVNYGEAKPDQPKQETRTDGGAVRRQASRVEGDSRGYESTGRGAFQRASQ